MNFQAILVANVTGFFLIVSLLWTRYIARRRWSMDEKIFLHIAVLPLIACIVEPLTFWVDGKPGALFYWLNLLGNTYLYAANLVGSYLWCLYVDLKLYNDKSRLLKYCYYKRFVLVLAITLAGNIWGGYYFSVDAQNVYHRQPMIMLFWVLCMACMFASVLILIIFIRARNGAKFFPIWYFLIPVTLGTVLQGAFYGISLAWLGVAIGLVAMQMSLQNERSYLDVLTGLYNRLFMEHTMWVMSREHSKNFYGIMIDIDYFKKINDTYGHAMGDQALKDVAEILDLHTPSFATAFRMAGDEFVLILKTQKESDVLETISAIKEALDRFNRSGRRPYQLSLSMGYAEFIRNTDTDDSFLKKMDGAMYLDKEKTHSRL